MAALSFAYFAVFYRMYRDPSQHPKLTREEREYLAAGGAEPEGAAAGAVGSTYSAVLSRPFSPLRRITRIICANAPPKRIAP